MNKKFAATLIATLALGLTACSSSDEEPQATETVTVAPAPETSSAEPTPTSEPEPSVSAGGDEELLLLVVREEPWFQDVPDQVIIDTARSGCSALDSGVSVEKALEISMDAGMPAYEAGYFLGAAVSALCPQHMEAMEEFSANYA